MKEIDVIKYYDNSVISTENFPSIISRDCCGGYFYKLLKLPYTTPTIGLYMDMEDFILLCCNLEEFINSEIIECKSKRKPFPVGSISCKYGTIYLYFMHYDSFSIAKEKWNCRKKRINFDNIVVICDGKNQINIELIQAFERIKYKKILLSSGIDLEQYHFGYNMRCYDNVNHTPNTLIKHIPNSEDIVYLDEYYWNNFFNN